MKTLITLAVAAITASPLLATPTAAVAAEARGCPTETVIQRIGPYGKGTVARREIVSCPRAEFAAFELAREGAATRSAPQVMIGKPLHNRRPMDE